MSRFSPWHLLAAAILCAGAGLGLAYLLPGRVPDMVSGLLIGIGIGLAFTALLRWRRPDDCDMATPALRRRYSREMFVAMAAYAAVLVLSVWLLKRIEAPALRAPVALLPVPPIALVLRAMVRYIRDADEMQQRIQLEAVSIATACVSLAYMAGGFLQAARVIDLPADAAMIWVFPLTCLAYGLAKLAVVRRYR
ncbi:hypothetical protein B1992_05470 [Pseudoxanthomonas broegbernensis]|uniref:Uncharacterized protein n=1 Tax=Pseudoxanthomonas broegbernensis TaxID=83619 RepID=A0A7V8GN11_9GAMM|nr:hypothetical protein [Pseudoxanthomonas broegbernensis]KAF1686844.1 hypothetical protein B1992_05470 [Pseudoxanthomonas broegbernensis]MBB6065570.1 hypothetical protein [Pseudoxanthomonas broegbernensis]